MWGRFWDSFGATDHHESESQLSDPLLHRAFSPDPSASFSQLQEFSEITPNESASMVANNEDIRSSMSAEEDLRSNKEDDFFSFKFSTSRGKTHRFASHCHSYAALLETVSQKVMGEHLAHLGTSMDNVPVESWLSMSYLDDENDKVLITSDADVLDAVKLARKMGQNRVKLFVHDATTNDREEAIPETVFEEKSETTVTSIPILENGKKTKRHSASSLKNKKKEVMISEDELEEVDKDDTIAGIPQELILPAAIAFLGVVIVGVFAFSRVSSNQR